MSLETYKRLTTRKGKRRARIVFAAEMFIRVCGIAIVGTALLLGISVILRVSGVA